MESSVLTQYKIKTEHRDRLYYEKYEYCFTFQQELLFSIKKLPNDEKLTRFVNFRAVWDKFNDTQAAERIKSLQRTRDLLLTSSADFKLVVTYNCGLLYTNDLDLGYSLLRLPALTPGKWVKQAKVTRVKDCIVIKNPKFKYRAYFKDRKIDQDQKNQLMSWIQNQADYIKPSAALKQWLTCGRNRWNADWLQRYYYIEYNDRYYETMLAMSFPDRIRKTLPVMAQD